MRRWIVLAGEFPDASGEQLKRAYITGVVRDQFLQMNRIACHLVCLPKLDSLFTVSGFDIGSPISKPALDLFEPAPQTPTLGFVLQIDMRGLAGKPEFAHQKRQVETRPVESQHDAHPLPHLDEIMQIAPANERLHLPVLQDADDRDDRLTRQPRCFNVQKSRILHERGKNP